MHTVYNFTSANMCPNVSISIMILQTKSTNTSQAAWLGDTIILCPLFDMADVVIHEWTHAYTTYIDNLFYQYVLLFCFLITSHCPCCFLMCSTDTKVGH